MFREHFSTEKNKVEDPGLIYTGTFGTFNWASGWTLLSQEGILVD